MAQTIKRFLVTAIAECEECQGNGSFATKPDSTYFTPDFGTEGDIVYRCTKCRGTGELKLTVDLEDALNSIHANQS